MANPIPTGEEMLKRQEIVYSRMERMLRKGSPEAFRTATGHHFLGELEYMTRYNPKGARAVAHYILNRLDAPCKPMPSYIFKLIIHMTQPETMRRRVQQIQSPEREALEKGIIELQDAIYLPSEKTLTKRKLLEFAIRNEMSRAAPYYNKLEEWI